jgi:hypothetical protein
MYFLFRKENFIYTDASYGIGGYLYQIVDAKAPCRFR